MTLVAGGWLGQMILKVFANPNDSVIIVSSDCTGALPLSLLLALDSCDLQLQDGIYADSEPDPATIY